MMQPYAVSAVVEKPDGAFVHANSIDAAEGHVIAKVLTEGRTLRGLLSRDALFFID